VRGRVAFILKGYPRLSETFIAQEIRALEGRGLDIVIVSLRRPTDLHVHPIHGEITAPVLQLPEYLRREPRRVLRAFRTARKRPGYRAARHAWLRVLARAPTANWVRRFGQALVLAHELPRDVVHLHAHFLHTPASVAWFASLITGLPWSCSAHAKDIWTSPAWEKSEKLGECRWLVTCTAANLDHLATLAPPGRVELAYHGIDLARFPPAARGRQPRDGTDANNPAVIHSVGRAVAKKGYDNLLVALSGLPRDLHWRLVHIGDGPLLEALKRQSRAAGIDGRIDWLGAQPQDVVLDNYRQADLFVLASRVADDGDRDGLPNVLMEALSQRLAVVSTCVSAVPELIDDGVSGRLVPPGDSVALGAALKALIADPASRARFADAGDTRVRRDFDMTRGIDLIAAKFGLAG
jgi:glycosyltransferase involved in cell wall biosynthesis